MSATISQRSNNTKLPNCAKTGFGSAYLNLRFLVYLIQDSSLQSIFPSYILEKIYLRDN